MINRMDWAKLLSTKRVSDIGVCKTDIINVSQLSDPRSEFEKDCDQLIFSYPFRRLQDKTQVIPFPAYDFVHTRLTHSLEVASVGRSFGKMAAELIFKKEQKFKESTKITISDIGNLVMAACLAHDIGNPPFGHSGEDSISYYFKESDDWLTWDINHPDIIHEVDGFVFKSQKSNGEIEQFRISKEEYYSEYKNWCDLKSFEGNANGFRILTQNCERGIDPTIALLGTFSKYPRESFLIKDPFTGKKMPKSQKKYGFFQAEKVLFKDVANELGLLEIEGIDENDIAFHRHPLAFLMEASDDISYGIIDFEDGCKLGLIDFDKHYQTVKIKGKYDVNIRNEIINDSPKGILIKIACLDSSFDINKVEKADNFKQAISYLRSKVINVLIHECFKVFSTNYEDIMTGTYDRALIEDMDSPILSELEKMQFLVRAYVYNYPPVLQSEASGFEVMYQLIDKLAVSSGICFSCGDMEDARQKKLSSLLPPEYILPEINSGEFSYVDKYKRMLVILDYISGMTDNYAISLFRKISGIELPNR